MASKGEKNLPPFFWGKGGSDQTDTTLSGGGDSPKKAIKKISEHLVENCGSYWPKTEIAINQ